MRNRRALERQRERLSMRGFGRAGSGVNFEPILLFAKYNATGLYIPDFDPARPAPIGTTRLFQDDEATTAALVATDPLGAIIDSGPTGTTIRQATDNSRLLLAVGNAGSRWVARGDGIADNALTNLNPAASMTMIVAVEFNAISDYVIGAFDGASARAAMQTDASGRLSGNVGTQVTSTIFGGSDIRDIPGVATIRYDGSLVSLFWKPFTGAFAKIYEGAQAGSAPTSTPLRLGARNDNGTAVGFLDGDIYAALAIRAALTDAEIAAVADRFSRG